MIGEDVELVAVLVADDELKVLIIQRDRLPDGVIREKAAGIELVIMPQQIVRETADGLGCRRLGRVDA